MRLLAYSYFPPLATHVAGGAQHVLRSSLTGLVEFGWSIEVLCPSPDDGDPLLELGPGLRISPVLGEARRRPLTPVERHADLTAVAEAAARSDLVLSVDRVFPLPTRKPLVLLLNNFSYGTEVDSVFSLAWDRLLVPSPYLKRCVASVAGPTHWVGGVRPISVLPPGLDLAHFRAGDGKALRRRLGLVPEHRCLLFPHRPDPRKGFEAALRVLRELLARDGRYRLLVPAPPRSARAVRRRESTFFRRFQARAAAMGIGHAVVLHEWLAYHDLPAYYSLGECTLMPSRLPEGFGLAPLESVACGTPAVVSPVGALPELLPEGCGVVLADEVADVVEAVRRPVAPAELTNGRAHIARAYGLERHSARLAELLTGTRKSRARYRPGGLESKATL